MGLLDDAIREHLDLKRRRGADPAEVERLEQEALGPVRREFDQPPAASAAVGESAWVEGSGGEDWEEDARTEFHEPAGGYHEPAGEFPAPPAELIDDEEEGDERRSVRPVSFQPRSLRDRFRRSKRVEDESPTDEGLYEDEFAGEDPLGDPFAEPQPEPVPEPGEQPSRPTPDPYAAPPAGGRDPREYTGQETVEYDALADEGEFHQGVRRIPREDASRPASAPPVAATPEPSPPAPGTAPAEPRSPAHDPSADEDVLEETPEFLHDTPEHDRLWFEQRPPRDFDFDG